MWSTVRQLIAASAILTQATALLSPAEPRVSTECCTFKGTRQYAGVDSFLGMPFAKAGRFENPRLYTAADRPSNAAVQDATKYGPACPQAELTASHTNEQAELGSILSAVEQLAFAPLLDQSEDCLSINVQVPQGVNSTAGLPVLMWIFGGGYELGSSASLGLELTAAEGVIYQGAHLVQTSVAMNKPLIFVSANYRINAFGGLASREMLAANATNLHLKDQRLAMHWIQRNIRAFGGDPSKVTLFGESAGSMSIATHLVLNGGDTEGLFRGAFMASGGIAKWKDYTYTQPVFDLFASRSGCAAAEDKLACLKAAPYDKLYDAVQTFPNFFSYLSTAVPWYPRPDGTYLPASPHVLLREGKVADVPYVIGDMKDEGTLFSFIPQANLSTDADVQKFFKDVFFTGLDDEQIRAFTDLYSQDPRDGSPFDTGEANQLGPQYKRVAAAVGDYTFQAGRRDLLNHTASRQPAWTYLIDQSIPLLGSIPSLAPSAQLPVLGSFHVSDVVLNDFGNVPASISKNTRNLMAAIVAFAVDLDPNGHGLEGVPQWPRWTESGREMLLFEEDGPRVIRDDFREGQMGFMNGHADTYVY